MSQRRVTPALALSIVLAVLLAAAGCHSAETSTAAGGGPRVSPMLTRIKQSQTPQPASARPPAH